MIDYPDDLPCASRIEGHSAAIFAGVVRSPLEAGAARQRRAHDGMPHLISLSFVMQQEVYAEWLLWVNAHAWDQWVSMPLPGLDASKLGTDTAPILVRFASDLRAELLPVHRLWYWRVYVEAEYLPNLTPPPPPLPLAAMWNPCDQGRSGLTMYFSEANRVAARTAPINATAACVRAVKSNGGVAGAKYYFELEIVALGALAHYTALGLAGAGVINSQGDFIAGTPVGAIPYFLMSGYLGTVWTGSGSGYVNRGDLASSFVNGDNFGFAWTVGTGVELYRNGVLVKTTTWAELGPMFPYFDAGSTPHGLDFSTGGQTCRIRAVPSEFAYPVPAGFAPWATGLEEVPNLIWDPVDGMVQSAGGVLTFVEEGKRVVKDSSTTNHGMLRAIAAAAKSSGKWYFEVECVKASPDPLALAVGVCKLDAVLGPKWFALAAGACTLNDGNGHLMQSAGTFAFGGSAFNGLTLGVMFEPGVGIKVRAPSSTTAPGTISTGVALPAGTYVPAVALGSDYTAATANAASSSFRLRTGADLWYAPPATYSVLT